MLTLAEVDEALGWLQAVPPEERHEPWHKYLDSLLEQRNALVKADRPKPVVVFSGGNA